MEKEYWGGQEERRNSNYYRGNSKKENNRARLIKELYGPERARLELEAHQRPEEHISEVLEEIMAQARMGDRIQFSDLLSKWEELVGESVSTYCKPTAIKGKTLMIEVTHASAMHVLETYKKTEILKRVRTVCKDVLSVRFIPSGSKI
ncbi:MAG: DUF721 domain-containing protein [Lentisphaeraceae bacterium]|nr:DUF721 domain-containing protein [Lentisphaeraceae bacterium]